MKTLLVLLSIFFCTFSFAGDNDAFLVFPIPDNDTNSTLEVSMFHLCTFSDNTTIEMDCSKTSAEFIKKLGKDGKLCEVYGHQWVSGRPGEGGAMIFTDYHTDTVFRHCRICGKTESRNIGWR